MELHSSARAFESPSPLNDVLTGRQGVLDGRLAKIATVHEYASHRVHDDPNGCGRDRRGVFAARARSGTLTGIEPGIFDASCVGAWRGRIV